MKKCKFDNNVIIKPDGVNELDPCVYETIEYYTNVDVEIVKCKKCGNIEVWWHRTPETEKIDLDEVDI